MQKATVEEIRARFDGDVERFANLETGQSSTMDAPLALDLIADAAAATTPGAVSLLDIGCGAGNFSLRVLQRLPRLAVSLIDLSRPMLDRATSRIASAGGTVSQAIQGDIREIDLPPASQDIVLAGAVLHHLRDDGQWLDVFTKVFQALRPGGSFWIFDLVESEIPAVREVMWTRYRQYLTHLKGPDYCREVLAYIDHEDSPRPLGYQMRMLRRVGFWHVDVLHKTACFAAFGAMRDGVR